MPQYIATGPNGERKAWNGEAWVSIPRADAKGLAYLPENVDRPDKSEAAYFNAWRKEQDPAVKSAETGLGDARRMEGLMAKQKTGGIYSVPIVGPVVGAFDPEIREMDAIHSKAARQNRVPGEGAISDFDAQQFLAMTYGKDKPTETNRALIQAQRLGNDAMIQRRTFNDWYYQTYGNRVGADEAWFQYARENPIFDPASEAQGAPRLNSKRQNWRQYFGAVRGPGDAQASQAQQDIERTAGRKAFPTNIPQRQLKAAQLYRGAKAQPGTKGNPYVPANLDEAKKIPPGAWMIDDDGTVFQKPGAR